MLSSEYSAAGDSPRIGSSFQPVRRFTMAGTPQFWTRSSQRKAESTFPSSAYKKPRSRSISRSSSVRCYGVRRRLAVYLLRMFGYRPRSRYPTIRPTTNEITSAWSMCICQFSRDFVGEQSGRMRCANILALPSTRAFNTYGSPFGENLDRRGLEVQRTCRRQRCCLFRTRDDPNSRSHSTPTRNSPAIPISRAA